MRSNPTQGESDFWNIVNKKKLGSQFQRQKVLLKYIVDFCCSRKRVIVEVDGGYHKNQRAYDNERTRALNKKGWFVLRFTNAAVRYRPKYVAWKVRQALNYRSHFGVRSTTSFLRPMKSFRRSGFQSGTSYRSPRMSTRLF